MRCNVDNSKQNEKVI